MDTDEENFIIKLTDPVFQAEQILRRVTTEAPPAEPWSWRCRECGETGTSADEDGRDAEALRHPCVQRHQILGWAPTGRLVHVWSYDAT